MEHVNDSDFFIQGMTIKPYTTEQLIEIVQKRLVFVQQGLSNPLPSYIEGDAIGIARMKLAGISGYLPV